MKESALSIALCLGMLSVFGQTETPATAARILENYWPAQWIACPGEPASQYGVFHFRKTFELAERPAHFVVHVSADNRYRLFVNGLPVSAGPARSDLANWNYETVDIAPQLKKGKNLIAALVWNAAEHRPFAQITFQTGFLLQGNTEKEDLVNTNAQWKVWKNEGYRPLVVDRRKLQAYMVTGDGDEVRADLCPWGWESPDFDDSSWKSAQMLWFPAKPRGLGTDGNWMLVPRSLPAFREDTVRAQAVRMGQASDFFKAGHPGVGMTIPPHSVVYILLDQGYLVNAYPELLVSKGKGAKVTLTYAEALFDKKRQKGNRNEVEGKEIMGIQDRFLPDGGNSRLFRPLWFRTYRFVQLEVETQAEALTLVDFHGMTYGYPFEENAAFKSSDPSHAAIWEAGWRTARLCAGENYFDCPYYEQLQYVGDTRIQALISLYVSGDDRLVRKAIEDFDHSRIPDGLTQSRFPCSDMQVIPTYSLFWVSMVHDYWMLRQDDAFIRRFKLGLEGVLAWHEARLAKNGMLGPVEWWNFVDWSWRWDETEQQGGVPPGVRKGGSSILALQFAYTLRQASELFAHWGDQAKAAHYAALADQLTSATYRLCWDEQKKLMADTPGKSSFSAHANYLAVLTDALPVAQQPALLQRTMADTTITQSTVYFRFYLFEALKKTGLGDRFLPALSDWRDMLSVGLTTFAEEPEPTRSDCHAWSASPNYEFLSTVLGINPGSPGFRTVRLAPFLGDLQFAEGKMPHPLGEIAVAYRKGSNGWEAKVTLPDQLDGQLVFQGKTWPLAAGKTQSILLK